MAKMAEDEDEMRRRKIAASEVVTRSEVVTSYFILAGIVLWQLWWFTKSYWVAIVGDIAVAFVVTVFSLSKLHAHLVKVVMRKQAERDMK